jgi:TolC family type I secretion outer membrane protein
MWKKNSVLRSMMLIIGAGLLLVAAETASVLASEDADSGNIDLNDITVLDLETAQKIALSDNPSLGAAEARVKQAKERIWQSYSGYLPQVTASGSETRTTLSDNAYGTQLITDPDADDSYKTYAVGISATWTLFDGFSREYELASARHSMKSSEEAHRDSVRLLLSSMASSYYNAQLALENINIAKANADFNQQQLDEAKANYRVGTGSLSEVLNFEVQINSAKSDLIDARSSYKVARYGLAALMGIESAELPEQLELETLVTEREEELVSPDKDAAISYALDHRPDIQESIHSVAQSEASVGVARAGFLPTVSLAGKVNASETDKRDFESDDFGNSVSLTVSLPLFAGGYNRAKYAEAAAGVRESQRSLDETLINLRAEVAEAVATLASSQEQLMLQRSNVELVQQVRDLVAKEYAAGQASLVRLNEAQNDLVSAQGKLAQSLVSMRSAWVTLRASTGEILGD